ncbi:MAG: patatin-like phospholipase family protein [Bacteroidales bacterium]|nr:patatin-like phospholipase family protein [Bacteroidales bacterium]
MENKKYKLGLALSGGGAKGFAHCGALKAMEEFGLYPDIISGTSAGAIVGALYASGNTPIEICKMFMGKEFSNFAKLAIPKAGFFDHTPFMAFLNTYLHVTNFEELKIPLFVVASDLDHGKSVVFSKGKLGPSLLASCSVPIVFNPVVIDGVHYVDGGIFRNFPVVPIRDLCEKVIGINVSPLMSNDYKQSIIQIAQRSYHFLFKANTFEDKALCDILVEMEEAQQYSTFDLDNISDIFKLGYSDMVNTLENVYNLKRVKPEAPVDFGDIEPKKTKKEGYLPSKLKVITDKKINLKAIINTEKQIMKKIK